MKLDGDTCTYRDSRMTTDTYRLLIYLLTYFNNILKFLKFVAKYFHEIFQAKKFHEILQH